MSYLDKPEDVARLEAMERYAEGTRLARMRDQQQEEAKHEQLRRMKAHWDERRRNASKLERAAAARRAREIRETNEHWLHEQRWKEETKRNQALERNRARK